MNTTRITDLGLTRDDLDRAVTNGWVTARPHPDDETLLIWNYTAQTQYAQKWDEVTVQCRGLITHCDTVVGRPWRKFHNWGDPNVGEIDPDGLAVVTDKRDGSLGVIYFAPDGQPAVATRGSFTSDMAVHATSVLRTRYADWTPPAGVTVLVEIIYPGNRIILDYGDYDDLFLLGGVVIATGRVLTVTEALAVSGWTGPVTDVMPAATLASALRLPPRPNAEGVVVHLVDSGVQVKIKQDDYLRLHRIAFSLSPKGVWEHLVAHGGDESELVAGIPDEFHGWIRDQASRLRQAFYGVYDVTLAAHRDLVAALPVGYSMKEFAFAVNALPSDALPNRQLLFSVERGNSIMGPIWKMIKPVSGEIPMLGGSLE